MAVNVRRFTGYSSQADRLLIDPAKGSQAINLCIYKNALCNLPYPSITAGTPDVLLWQEINSERLMTFWYIGGFVYLVIFSSSGKITVYRNNPFDDSFIPWTFSNNTIDNILPYFSIHSDYQDDNDFSLISGISGNLLQVGSYVFFLCRLGPRSILNQTPRTFMIKLKKRVGSTILDPRVTSIGLPEISSVTIQSTAAGSITGTYDFAFTIATQYDFFDEPTIDTTSLGEHDIEGNAFIVDSEDTYSSEEITFRLYLEAGLNLLGQDSQGTRYKLGLYIKEQSDAFYYFGGYVDAIFQQSGIDSNGPYFEFTISSIPTLDRTQVAPGFGDNPRREAPQVSLHATEYKSRVYYANLESNQLEYSQIFLDDSPHKKESQYIEGAELIGSNDDYLSGVIVYLGQLIIFKGASTYVLTDEITQGQIRELFRDKGCVNVHGGKAYIVVNDILYFLDRSGLYMWNGQGDPVKISKDIEEDLEKVREKQFGLARLSIDFRYDLLYLTFPRGHLLPQDQTFQPAFIYHYGEIQDNGIGVWTKTDAGFKLSDIATDRNIVSTDTRPAIVYQNKSHRLERLGVISNSLSSSEYGRTWGWSSGVLDLGDPLQDKHFKRLALYLKGFTNTDELYIGHEVEEIFQSTRTFTDIVKAVSELRLGFTTGRYVLSFGSYNADSTRRAFRIGGYNIDVHKRGRR